MPSFQKGKTWKGAPARQAPADKTATMIIPKGTDIQVDVHGQLDIRTPGNLVIENSGNYGTLESTHGSIRIEAHAEVEAVHVKCASICYVEGSLTAWKVAAQSIQLEDRARANIVLQETEQLEVGKEARLVGNYSSEKELFLTFSRFAQQLRQLPLFSERGDLPQGEAAGRELRAAVHAAESPTPLAALAPPETAGSGDGAGSRTAAAAEAGSAPPTGTVQDLLAGGGSAGADAALGAPRGGDGGHGEPVEVPRADGELPDALFFALVLLEREFSRSAYGPTSQRVIEELIKLLHERDLDTLALTYRTLCGRVVEPGPDVRRAHDLMRDYFQKRA